MSLNYGGQGAGEHAFEGVKVLKAALEAGVDCAFMENPRGKEEGSRSDEALEGNTGNSSSYRTLLEIE